MHFIKYPYLQRPDVDSITIMWETDEDSTSELHIWKSFCPDCGDVQYSPIGDPLVFYGNNGFIHSVTAHELACETDYCYKVISKCKDSFIESTLSIFRTSPMNDSPLSFIVTSETGGAKSPAHIIDTLVTSIASERPDFLIFAGDMVSDGNRRQDWDDYLFTPFKKLLLNTPFYHCAGNCENHSHYMKLFLATSENGYYDFTYGCAHFIALDSTVLAEHMCDENGSLSIQLIQPLDENNQQIKFLIAALKNSTYLWKFVYLHYPPYFSGTWEANVLRPLCRIFEKYDVDIVFTSHAIVYERSHPIRDNTIDYTNGVRYIVAGGAGAYPQFFNHKKAWHTAKNHAVPHFVHISVTEEVLELQAIDYEGNLFDSITLVK